MSAGGVASATGNTRARRCGARARGVRLAVLEAVELRLFVCMVVFGILAGLAVGVAVAWADSAMRDFQGLELLEHMVGGVASGCC